jgi:cytochrome c-type biogenesis protein CcmF
MLRAVRAARAHYAGMLIHAGFVCLALGVTGSSLGTRQQDFTMHAGQTISWAGHQLRLVGLHQRRLTDKLIGEAELEVCRDGQVLATLRPAQHFHLHGQQWTTEVAIHSSWSGDVYTILHSTDAEGSVRLTFVHNPLMRWLWLGGCLMGLGAAIRLWPARQMSLAMAIPISASRQQPESGRRAVAAASLLLMIFSCEQTAGGLAEGCFQAAAGSAEPAQVARYSE